VSGGAGSGMDAGRPAGGPPGPAGWADPASWGSWQIAALLVAVVVLALFAFLAVGG
jgi:hypothetical protein